VLVTPDNFARAESDLYFSRIVGDDGFGRFFHTRELTPIDHQVVIRQNRDTLYSAAVFDLDAAPVTITLPDSGSRFMSAQVISEDHYTVQVAYAPATLSLTRDEVGTRYATVAVRTLVEPGDVDDLATVRGLQDAVTVAQDRPGSFVVPAWDSVSQQTVRNALITLATTLPDSQRMFGTPADTDPVRHLIGSANAWGGNPERDALYLTVTPARNDGVTAHRLTVRDVPVDGFWSVTVYNKDGYFTGNAEDAYSVNNITAVKDPDGKTTIAFGGADATNLLPVTEGWNYIVRLYRPRPEILDGSWSFPDAEPV
jgi:hypothetical protein